MLLTTLLFIKLQSGCTKSLIQVLQMKMQFLLHCIHLYNVHSVTQKLLDLEELNYLPELTADSKALGLFQYNINFEVFLLCKSTIFQLLLQLLYFLHGMKESYVLAVINAVFAKRKNAAADLTSCC